MDHFSICRNPKCRFVLDRRVNGKSLEDPLLILKKCPACGGGWSSTCPFCGQALTLKLIDRHLHSSCCGQRLQPRARAA
jgi:ssDNA-binding Zn-finger/Zn-ribbon topoisomerase 1